MLDTVPMILWACPVVRQHEGGHRDGHDDRNRAKKCPCHESLPHNNTQVPGIEKREISRFSSDVLATKKSLGFDVLTDFFG